MASSEMYWRIYFIKGCDNVVAFCPYTGIAATGKTTLRAARHWERIAREVLNCSSIVVPRYLLSSCKVWFNRDGVIIMGISNDFWLICPDDEKRMVTHFDSSNPPEGGAMEERISCTVLMRYVRDPIATKDNPNTSLTPQYIN